MSRIGRRGGLAGIPGLVAGGLAPPAARADAKTIEEAVLAVSAEMTGAREAVDADRLFGDVLDTDKVSVIQNGVVMTTRQEALEQVRGNLRGIASIRYRWKRQYVTVLSPEIAVLAAKRIQDPTPLQAPAARVWSERARLPGAEAAAAR